MHLAEKTLLGNLSMGKSAKKAVVEWVENNK